MDITNIKAFDYHPSISDMLIDHWRRTDTATMAEELSAIQKQHPDRNAVRITHSFEAYQRSPKQYRKLHEERLELCDSLGLKVIECLFNQNAHVLILLKSVRMPYVAVTRQTFIYWLYHSTV